MDRPNSQIALIGDERPLAAADGDAGGGPAAPISRIKIRIESLSDLVFGLALSIGSLILIGRAPQSGQDLAVNVLLFGFGFLIVVMTWLGYSRTMGALPVEVPYALYANLLLLFCVALEPYLFYVLQTVQTFDLLDSASIAYALDVGGMFFLLAALAYLVVKEERSGMDGRRRLHPVVLARFRRAMKLQAIVGVIFVVSALPIFWVSTPVGFLRFYLWPSSSLIFFVGRGSRKSAIKES
jgi:uncharacterized membrane protein